MFRLKSIGSILALIISFVFLCMVIISVIWLSSYSYKSNLEAQNDNMRQLVNSTVASIHQYIEEGKGVTHLLSSQKGIVETLQGNTNNNAAQLIKNTIYSFPIFGAILICDNNGKVILGETVNGKDLTGTSLQGKSFFTKAQSETSDNIVVNSSVFKAEELQSASGSDIGAELLFSISQNVKDNQGKSLGWVITFPNWGQFLESSFNPIRVGKEGYGFIYDSTGITVAHAVSKSTLFSDVSKTDRFKTMQKTTRGSFEYEYQGRAKAMVYDLLPETGWYIVFSAYKDDLAASAIQQRNILIIGGISAVLLIAVVCIVLLNKLLVAPIRSILEYTEKITDGDLSARLDGTFKFEFTTLASRIQEMVTQLKHKLGFSEGVLKGMNIPCMIVDPEAKIVWTNKPTCKLCGTDKKPEEWIGKRVGEFFYGDPSHETVAEKSLQTEQTYDMERQHTFPSGKEAILHVTSLPFYDIDKKLLGSVTYLIDLTDIRKQQHQIELQNEKISQAADEADQISQNLSSASEELSSQLDHASQRAETQRGRMAETATAMSQMNASVFEVARNASEASNMTIEARQEAQVGANNLSDLINIIGEVQTQALGLKNSMNELGQQAQSIGSIMNVITDIADQTNLLALNAAIEAARAGEAGRGFAVVADEVRKLAEKTMTATQEVGSAINNIQKVANVNIQATDNTVNKIGESTELADKSGVVLKKIVEMMDQTASQVGNIATAAEEQSATSDQINRSTEEVSVISQEVSEIMEQSTDAVQEVARMASELNNVIEAMSQA